MREALSSLTLRGRGFLLVGIAAIACAVVIGQATLISVGVLSLALPLIAALYISRSKYRLALERTVSPAVVTAGQVAHVGLRLTNEGRTPAGALLLEDSLPSGLGARPRFVMEGIGHGWNRQVTYPCGPTCAGATRSDP